MQQRLAQLSLQQPRAGAGQAQQRQAAEQRKGAQQEAPAFDSRREYLYQECLYGVEGRPPAADYAGAAEAGQHPADQQPQQQGDAGAHQQPHSGPQWAYLRFSQPVTAPVDALVIGSRLDADLNAASCRLAFHGRLVALVDPEGRFVLGGWVDEDGGLVALVDPEGKVWMGGWCGWLAGQ